MVDHVNLTEEREKHLNIQMRLSFDPNYIEKAKKSICKNCQYTAGFNGEYYLCHLVGGGQVKYKREGVFHTQVIECDCFMRED